MEYAGRIKFVQRVSSGGIPFGVYEDTIVPRIRDQFLDIAVYLYGSERHAVKGIESGGSGFLVWMQSERHMELWHYFVVTNRHVIESGACVVRLNTKDGLHETIVLTENDWVLSQEHDLAIALVELPLKKFEYKGVPFDFFITKEIIKENEIGVGDDTFLIGRFVNAEGKQKNRPCVRSGTIAMMADAAELIQCGKKAYEAFLVELRTKCGFSGSPVFVQMFSNQQWRGSYPALERTPSPSGPWLLGVHIGQMQDTTELAVKSNQTDTGMAIVVPAWHLAELLNDGRAAMRRKEADERYASKKPAPVKLESLSAKNEDGITRDECENALKKASRKLPPESSESDQEKP